MDTKDIIIEAIKIRALLKSKVGYIKSKKGNIMKLKISSITFNGNKFMVNGYCVESDNCRNVPLNKVYVAVIDENTDDLESDE